MSKQFKFKPCVYCAGAQVSSTADHVFARQFFLEADRGNLPKVPACEACNRKKSELEHYLATVLPFGGLHAASGENLTTQVPKRLAKNQRLHRKLGAGFVKRPSSPTLGVDGAAIIPFDGEKLNELYGMIGRGLSWHVWQLTLEPNTVVLSYSLNAYGEALFSKLLSLEGKQRVSCDLGNGTIFYEGVLINQGGAICAWRIRFYGGVLLSEGEIGKENTTSSGGVLIGNPPST